MNNLPPATHHSTAGTGSGISANLTPASTIASMRLSQHRLQHPIPLDALLNTVTFSATTGEPVDCSYSVRARVRGIDNKRLSGLYTRLTEAVRLRQAA